MSYVQSSLMKNETVKYETKLHWSIFLGPSVSLFFGLLYMTLVKFDFGLVVSLIALAYLARAFLRYYSSEFAITNKRVILKQGIIFRNTVETNLDKIEGIGVQQGIVARILNYGNVVISGTGGLKEVFLDIDDPVQFRKHISN